jgi:hypothetical protein
MQDPCIWIHTVIFSSALNPFLRAQARDGVFSKVKESQILFIDRPGGTALHEYDSVTASHDSRHDWRVGGFFVHPVHVTNFPLEPSCKWGWPKLQVWGRRGAELRNFCQITANDFTRPTLA